MNLRPTLLLLVAGALFLPIAIVVLLVVGRLLVALEDPTGAAVVERVSLGLGIVWALALVGLPLVLAIQSLAASHRADDEAVDEAEP